jgi:uncharacterized oxidoreductase
MVTGGGRGIGLSLARRLVQEGVRLVLVGRDGEALDSARQLAPGTVTVTADLADPHDRSRVIEAALANEVDLLFNNAGIQVNGGWLARGPVAVQEDLARELAVNLEAPLALIAGLLPSLAHRQGAAVVNVTSGLAIAPKASAPVYCATKAALRSATRSLRYQMEDTGSALRFVDVVLPLVDTDMTRGRGRRKASSESVADQIVAGLLRGEDEIWVGQAGMLRRIVRLSPRAAHRILRGTTDG